MSFIPKVMRTGGVEPPQPEALALQAGELADAQRPLVEGGGRPDSNRRRGDHDPECSPLHHGHSGDGRARTGGVSPDKRALWPSELRPHQSRAGGIRTHGLELMRLARTTAPLPRSGLAGRTRTCERMTACGLATRCLSSSAMPAKQAEGEGVEPPRAGQPHPFSGRDTAPMAVLPGSGPGRRRTCMLPVKSQGALPCVELRSRDDVTGRGRTCDAPRFKRALYRLSYGHVNWRSRTRTGGLLLIREALCQLSYPPARREPRVPVQLPVGSSTHTRLFWTRPGHVLVVRSSPTMLFMPLAYPSTLDRRPWGAASYVEGCWSPVLNSAIEIDRRK
ncbi:MAG: hypothetical protein QOJ73_582 [Streptosporangiaceae bacterium]|nr:hypothetical protein [Streptosporangiaceae bacterium]